MKIISSKIITGKVANLCIQANTILRKDILFLLEKSFKIEKNKRAKDILSNVIENAEIAKNESLPICQDTGLPIVFIELGSQIKIEGDLNRAINRGVELGYRKGNFRKSIIIDPLCRTKPVYSPAIIHTDIIEGDKIKIAVLPKGFGAENKNQLKMFRPTATLSEIENFILKTIKNDKSTKYRSDGFRWFNDGFRRRHRNCTNAYCWVAYSGKYQLSCFKKC